jgi:hypothetical protein
MLKEQREKELFEDEQTDEIMNVFKDFKKKIKNELLSPEAPKHRFITNSQFKTPAQFYPFKNKTSLAEFFSPSENKHGNIQILKDFKTVSLKDFDPKSRINSKILNTKGRRESINQIEDEDERLASYIIKNKFVKSLNNSDFKKSLKNDDTQEAASISRWKSTVPAMINHDLPYLDKIKQYKGMITHRRFHAKSDYFVSNQNYVDQFNSDKPGIWLFYV